MATAAKNRAMATAAKAGACVVYLPKLPLQMLWRKRPEWRNDAVAIVADDTPEAPLLMLSQRAVQKGLRQGLRHGAARNLLLDLRTAVISDDEIETLCEELARALQTFSPRVERVEGCPGAFFVDPTGFELLYGGKGPWARIVHRYLRGRGLHPRVVVGFDRYRCLALAHAPGATSQVLESEAQETELSDAVELRHLGFPEKLCDPLSMLEIDRLGEFLAIPPGELHTRFGREAASLHARFSRRQQLPLQPMGFEVPRRLVVEVMPPSKDRERLLFSLKSALDTLLVETKAKGERVVALNLEFFLERYGLRRLTEEERLVHARLEAATPTIDGRALLELIRLRLGQLQMHAPVEEFALEAEVVPLTGEQLDTPGERPRRDVHAAAEALAKVTATFGQRSVCRALVRDAHLPEAKFQWSAFTNAKEALAEQQSQNRRRIKGQPPATDVYQGADERANSDKRAEGLFAQRRLLPIPEPLVSDGEGGFVWHEPIVQRHGPYRLNGGWWGREAGGEPSIDRDYYYAQSRGGELLWVFYDRRRDRWLLHGRVE